MVIVPLTFLFFCFYRMTPQTIKAANSSLYMGCVLMVVGACVYTVLTRELSPLYLTGIIAAGCVSALWGLHYFILRYTVDELGITVRSIRGKKCLLWADVTGASLDKTDSNGVASLHIILTHPAGQLRLSSDLLPMDDLELLSEKLKKIGLLS